jgi:hypothetical protein
MKKSIRLFVQLPLVVTCAIVFSNCDLPEIKEDHTDSSDYVVSVRTDCEECSDCCCAITLDDDTSVTLQLCGTEDGLSACTDSGLDCQEVELSGGGQFVVLTSATVIRHVFCMLEISTLRITNPSMTDEANFTITCQFDSGLPQILEVHLDAPQTKWFDIVDGCVVEQRNN